MMGNRSGSSGRRAGGLLLWITLLTLAQAQLDLEQSITVTPQGEWQILWRSEPGEDYTLQRSRDLITWENVTTLTAEATTTGYVEEAAANEPLMMWRVLGPDGTATDPIKVSDASPTLTANTSADTTTLGVVIESEEPIATVKYFDGDAELGTASPTLGGGWIFPLEQNPAVPRIVQLSVEVTTVSGTTVRTPANGFLVADPAKFVALQPRAAQQVKEGFVSQTGAFIEATAEGLLEPFLYYPEGVGDPQLLTSAHFAFAAGATLIEEAGITRLLFDEADFHRSALDEFPIPSRPGSHELDLENVVPGWLQDHFAVATGEPVRLLWGGTEVAWESGSLGSDGWAGLEVTPPLGDFILPAFRTNVRISSDPESGETFLTVCFHGEWAPIPNSELTFRIPQADPLKVYLSTGGDLEAHGTLEAVFPDGAEVRGSVSWRDPNFEISLEGRGFTIPALGSLKNLAPVNPLANLPSGNSEAELDELTERLFAYRQIYRNLATSGLKHADITDLTEYLPAAGPTNGAGSVLEAWAWRLHSWASDRAGESLTDASLAELEELIAGAAKTAEAAHDLPSALKLLRDFLILTEGAIEAIDGNAGFDTLLQESQNQIFSAVERIISESTALDEDPAQFDAIVSLLEQVSEAAEPLTQEIEGNGILAAEGDTPVVRAQRIYNRILDKTDILFFIDGQRVVIPTMSPQELLTFMGHLRNQYKATLRRSNSAQRQADLAALETGRDEAKSAFVQAQNTLGAETLNTGAYGTLFQILEDRTAFLTLLEELGGRNFTNAFGFNPNTATILNRVLDLRKLRPPSAQALDCKRFERLVRILPYVGGDFALETALARAQENVESCLNFQHGACGLLEKELAPPEVVWMPSEFPSFSGKYESVEAPSTPWSSFTAYGTLQVNQGGRYILGRVQEQRGDHQIAFHFEGLLKAKGVEPEGDAFVEFAIRLQRETVGPGGEFPSSLGTLRVRHDSDGNQFFLKLTSGDVSPSEFQRTSRAPAFSDSIITTFPEKFRPAIEATQYHPLHSKIVSEIVRRLDDVRTAEEIAQGMMTPKGIKEAIKLYYFPQGGTSDFFATTINNKIAEILGDPANPDPIRTGGIITKAQLPAARLLMTQVLERDTEMFQRTGRVDGSELNLRTYWVALNTLVLFANSELDLAQIERLTGTPRAEFASGKTYTYTFTIKQKTVGGVVAGGASLTVEILKQHPPEDDEDDELFEYDGDLWGASPGLGGGVTVSSTTSDPIPSPFNYSEDQLAGELEFGQLSATLAIGGFGTTIGGNTFTFDGNGELPSITFWTGSFFDPVKGLALAAGLDGWTGRIVPKGSDVNLAGNTVQFTASGHPDLPDAVFFDIGKPTLTDCGRQALRMFVARHRALVGSVGARIEIEGFTDRTDTADANLVLSRDRAENVKAALIEIMGTGLQIPLEQIMTSGRGEEQAALDGLPDEPNPQANNPNYRRAEIAVSGLVKAIVQEN